MFTYCALWWLSLCLLITKFWLCTELEGEKISSTVTNAVVATQWSWKIVILVLKGQCIMTVLFALRYGTPTNSFLAFWMDQHLDTGFPCKLIVCLGLQYLFESRNDVTVLPCGHTIHKKCLDEMQEHCQWVLWFPCCVFSFIVVCMNWAVIWTTVWSHLADLLAPFALSQFVTCLRCGRNLTWKLLQHQCPNLTRIRWWVISLTLPSINYSHGRCD